MRKFLLILACFILLCGCNRGYDPHPELQKYNKGYLFDSAAYLINTGEEGCRGTCDTIKHLRTNIWHMCFCPKFGYIPYHKLPYKEMSLSKVLAIMGEPTDSWMDTTYYGYHPWNDPHADTSLPDFCITDFDGPEGQLWESQEFYRVSKFLNHPVNIIYTAIWNKEHYLRLHFLVTPKDTLVFHGFQSVHDRDFLWQI